MPTGRGDLAPPSPKRSATPSSEIGSSGFCGSFSGSTGTPSPPERILWSCPKKDPTSNALDWIRPFGNCSPCWEDLKKKVAATARPHKPSTMRTLFLACIRLYQLVLSPLTPPHCRFQPTCSEYAREAVERFGPLRGGLLAAKRLAKCHPFGGRGFDPVPETLHKHEPATAATGPNACIRPALTERHHHGQ